MMLVQHPPGTPYEPPPLTLSLERNYHTDTKLSSHISQDRESIRHSSPKSELPPIINHLPGIYNSTSSVYSNGTNSPQEARYSLRPALVSDAQAIAELGAATFAVTHGDTIPRADLKKYLEEAYTTAAIERDILDDEKHLFVACAEDIVFAEDNDDGDRQCERGKIVGFTQLTEGTAEPCLDGIEDLVELQRLYVDQRCHRLGIGKALLKAIEERARELEYRNIWLGVWEGNFSAQTVYEALGFERVGDHEFMIGRCIQMDWIMCKTI